MSVLMASYGQERPINATAEELAVFDVVREVLDQNGLDASILELTRKADGYVTAVIRSKEYGPIDVCRFKFSPRTAWIMFPLRGTARVKITSPDDVRQYAEELKKEYLWQVKYL